MRIALGNALERYWPPNHATKKHHWCLDSSREEGLYYCDDSSVGSPQYDPHFDYSVFGCRAAKCQTCLDVNPEFYPPRELWLGLNLDKDPKSREIHCTWGALRHSKDSGCETCRILVEGIEFVSCGMKEFGTGSVFRVDILEGFTVKVTLETAPEEEEESIQLHKFAVEFHSRAGQSLTL